MSSEGSPSPGAECFGTWRTLAPRAEKVPAVGVSKEAPEEEQAAKTATSPPPSRPAFSSWIGIHKDQGECLTALLSHYSDLIVYLGYSFWRKLLLRVTKEAMRDLVHVLETKDIACSALLSQKGAGSQHEHKQSFDNSPGCAPPSFVLGPRELGIAGQLAAVPVLLPPYFFSTEWTRGKRPLTPQEIKVKSPIFFEFVRKKGNERKTSHFAKFLYSLVCGDQLDAVNALLSSPLRVSVKSTTWLYDEKAPTHWAVDKCCSSERRNDNNRNSNCLALPPQQRMIQLLLRFGADVNVGDHAGWSPLMHAVDNRFDPDLARFLLRSGANIKHTSKLGDSLLHKASDVASAQVLLDHGLSINYTKNGWTALHTAIADYRFDYAEFLITAQTRWPEAAGESGPEGGGGGREGNHKGEEGGSFHERRRRSGYCSTHPGLLRDVGQEAMQATTTKDNWTPLHLACNQCQPGEDIGYGDGSGQWSHKRMIKFLIQHGADRTPTTASKLPWDLLASELQDDSELRAAFGK